MQDAVILSAVRTPIGAFQGAFQSLQAHQLGAVAIRGAIEAADVPPEAVDQVNMGNVLTAGQGQAPARQAAIGAGLPISAGAITVNKVCGSGMRTVMIGANDLRCGDFSLVVAGGMESMSRAPYLLPGARDGLRMGNSSFIDSMITDGLWDPYGDKHMGNCAELCANEYSFSREEQDAYATASYQRARQAAENGGFDAEIVAVDVPQRKGDPVVVTADEDPFRVDLSRLSGLRPAFDREGSVTAGNASNLSDGASALVLASAARADELGAKPIARIVAQASFAQEPEWFTTAPVGAIKRVLDRAGLAAEDIDLFEINEAFAVVALACMKELGLDHDKVNVKGGAVSLGHPIGASGARIITTLLHAMAERDAKLGCAGICIGGGEATALVVERLS